jgi:hypothetical protein
MTVQGDRERAVIALARKALEDSQRATITEVSTDPSERHSAYWHGRLEAVVQSLLELVDPREAS